MSKQMLITDILAKFGQLGISATQGQGTDILLSCEFLDAAWGTGKKKINYDAAAFFDEASQTVFMWELTKEVGSGISFGGNSETSMQSGMTLFRKVKSIQYGPDGKAYEYSLDLGAIPKTVKEVAKQYGWKFKTVLKREKASYPAGYLPVTTAPNVAVAEMPPVTAEPPTPNIPEQHVAPAPPPGIPEQHVAPAPPPGIPEQHVAPTPAANIPEQPVTPAAPLAGINQQAYNNPAGQFYAEAGKSVVKKKTGVLFWVLFALLGILDALLILGDSGIVFAIGSILVLLVLLVTRKSIASSLLKTFLFFGIGTILTFILFAFSAGNSDVANAELTIQDANTPNIVVEGFARTIEADTLRPIEKTTAFTQTDEFIYYALFIKNLPAMTEFQVKWYFNGELALENQPQAVAEALTDQYYTTQLQKGDNPFPMGEYKVELVILKDGAEIYQATDVCQVGEASGDVAPASGDAVLFADNFSRPDSELVGDQWQEVMLRNGTGSSVPTAAAGDSPWRVKNNSLSYEGVGNNTYTEDYIQTIAEYPIDNVLVEFELRATAATSQGYVGPGVFWAPAVEKRLGGFATNDEKQQLIGIDAFYGWESGGTKGLVFRLAGAVKSTEDTMAGVNQPEFAKQSILVKDGKLIYTNEAATLIYELTNIPEAGAKRHLSFDVRYYDNGVPFKVEIRNLKITQMQ